MGDWSQAPWGRAVDEAWRDFRRQLADHLAAMQDGEVLVVELETGTSADGLEGADGLERFDELEGAAPYVQFVCWGDGEVVRAEAASEHYLDPRFAVSDAAEQALIDAGWQAPTYALDEEPDHGSANWWCDQEPREADLLAARAVVALRDAFGAAHPSFLQVEGRLVLTGVAAGGTDEASADERAAAVADGDDEPDVLFPHGPDELREMVVAALERLVPHPVETDEDGDVPMPAGRSVLYVQTLPDEPTISLWARLATDVVDRERAALEVALLNRDLVFGTVVLTDGGAVDFRHHLCAVPFAPQQLRLVVARVLSDLDRRAGDLVRRLGGRRWLDDEPSREPLDDAVGDPVTDGVHDGVHDGVVGLWDTPLEVDNPAGRRAQSAPVSADLLVLRELLVAGAADPRTVAAVWDGDPRAMALEIEELQSDPPAVLDVPDAISALREAIVFVAERRSRQRWSRPTRPPGRRPQSQQQSLLGSDEVGEAVLDLGVDP